MGGLSVYSAYCIARLARDTGVTVALNGQGGDEVLSGYWQTYFAYLRSLAQRGQILLLGRHLAGSLLEDGNPELLIQVPVMLRRYRERSRPQTFVRFRGSIADNVSGALTEFLALPEQARRVYGIRSMFLPRLLKWDDRNTMAFGVEGRYPFLDHELIELCLSFVPGTLFHRGWVKWPLRLGLKDLLPATILQRRTKLGFEVPQNRWLCGTLRAAIDRWFEEDRPVWELVEKHHVKGLADKIWNEDRKYDEPGQLLLRLFLFDRWLGLFGVAP